MPAAPHHTMKKGEEPQQPRVIRMGAKDGLKGLMDNKEPTREEKERYREALEQHVVERDRRQDQERRNAQALALANKSSMLDKLGVDNYLDRERQAALEDQFYLRDKGKELHFDPMNVIEYTVAKRDQDDLVNALDQQVCWALS